MPNELSERQKKHLRGLGHTLHPLVTVADKGLSETVMKEITGALEHHELIKIKVRVGDRTVRDQLLADLVTRTDALLLQRVGNIALVYKSPPKDPKIKLP